MTTGLILKAEIHIPTYEHTSKLHAPCSFSQSLSSTVLFYSVAGVLEIPPQQTNKLNEIALQLIEEEHHPYFPVV